MQIHIKSAKLTYFGRKQMFKKTIVRGFLAAVAAAAVGASVSIADEVFTTGPTLGTFGGYNVNFDYGSQEFTVTAPTTLTSATVGLWAPVGVPTTLTWQITSSPDGTGTLYGGASTVPLTNTQLTPASDYGDSGADGVFNSQFQMSVPLAAGTYWLDITQAATTQSGAGYWDVNTLTLNGPYTAYLGGAPLEFDLGYGDEQSGQFAGTFALSLDGGQSVPEPAVAIGLCTTLAGLGFVSLRQRKAKA